MSEQNQINVEIVGKIIGINVKPEIEYTLLVFSGTVCDCVCLHALCLCLCGPTSVLRHFLNALHAHFSSQTQWNYNRISDWQLKQQQDCKKS